jgi:hypothetical protein
MAKAQRRKFSAEYKLAIVEEARPRHRSGRDRLRAAACRALEIPRASYAAVRELVPVEAFPDAFLGPFSALSGTNTTTAASPC